MRMLLLGCARSGTSMIASLFSSTKAFEGQELLPPTISNPKGYYEDRAINDINNCIIEQMLMWPALNYRVRLRIAPTPHRDRRAFAVASPQRIRPLALPSELIHRIEEKSSQPNYCYKDPRFSNTLPYWRPHLPPDVKFLVAFREPQRYVESYMRNANEVYDPPIQVNERWLYRAWRRAYKKILKKYSGQGEWLFVHYNQVLARDGADRIAEFCGVELNLDHIDAGMSRTQQSYRPGQDVTDRKCLPLYRELCQRAGYEVSCP